MQTCQLLLAANNNELAPPDPDSRLAESRPQEKRAARPAEGSLNKRPGRPGRLSCALAAC